MTENRTGSMLNTFLDDSEDTLEGIEVALLRLDKKPGDRDTLNGLFRLVHSFKGAARFMGFSRTAELAHRIESVLDGIRKREYQYDSIVASLLFASFSKLREVIELIGKMGNDRKVEISEVMTQLEEFSENAASKVSGSCAEEGESAEEGSPDEPENARLSFGEEPIDWSIVLAGEERKALVTSSEKGNVWSIRFAAEAESGMQIARIILTLRALEAQSSFFKSLPAPEYVEQEYTGSIDLLLVSDLNEEELRGKFQPNTVVHRIRKLDFETPPGEKRENGREDEEDAAEPQSDAPAEKPAPEESGGALPDDDEPVEEEVTSPDSPLKQSGTVKVDISKMDDLLNLLGELVINRTRNEDLVQDIESRINDQKMIEELHESLNEQSQIINDIQEKVMSSRLVAVRSIFREVSFVVRDMSKRLEKEVDCRIAGENTELDKRLVDNIRKPIMHIVKNALDHGLEKPDEREKKGKSREGVISVEAHREHNQIIITITDDGRGIDRDEIRETAQKRGLLEPGSTDPLDEDKMAEILCTPGFSSRNEVTGDSGRGVGMDVAKSIIEEFNGKMEIHSEQGSGTTVVLRLPITLAIIQGLVIEDHEIRYIIPISVISEVIRIKYGDIDIRANGDMMLKHRGGVMRIREFGRLLKGERRGRRPGEDCFIIVVKMRGEWRGLIVDDLVGEREVVIKEIKKTFLSTHGISGVSIMGDGSMVPVVDIGELLRTGGIAKMVKVNNS